MRKSQISASMMCSNLVDLQATIDVFEKEKVEYLHIDVMDGEFVPNFGLGVDYIRGLRELTSIPLDLHLMIKDPEYKLPWIGIHKEDIVTIHYESTFQVQRALDYLVPYGCKRFLAINPATPIGQIEEVLDYIDGVNLLMVNPGFAGQKIVPSTLRKAEKLQKFLQEMHREETLRRSTARRCVPVEPAFLWRELRAFSAPMYRTSEKKSGNSGKQWNKKKNCLPGMHGLKNRRIL